jgi:anti-anti-sigma regulatory factor
MSVVVTEQDGTLTVGVSGAITEASSFADVIEKARDRVVVDLHGVERVNSYGVREWINFIKALAEKNTRVVLDQVSIPMVRQMNMIPQVRHKAEVRTVFAPYYCETCDDERAIALAPGAKDAPETAPCPTCGAAMEFDDVPTAFFAFRKDDP